MNIHDLFFRKKAKQEAKMPDLIRLTKRKEITPPSYFDGIDLAGLNRGKPIGFFASGCDGVIVKPWLPELGGICMTIILDKVLEQAGTASGSIIFCTGENCPVDLYLAIGSLEMQSSGIEYAGSFQHQGMDVMVLNVDAGHVKKAIAIPDDPWIAFPWRASNDDGQCIPVHYLPTETLGGTVTLSFAVCGEFNLYMYFVKGGETTLQYLISKGFCCK